MSPNPNNTMSKLLAYSESSGQPENDLLATVKDQVKLLKYSSETISLTRIRLKLLPPSSKNIPLFSMSPSKKPIHSLWIPTWSPSR